MRQELCDGCHQLLAPEAATTVGAVDPVVYCAACLVRWTGVEAAITAARLEAVSTFTAARAELLEKARLALHALPDGG